MLAIHRGVIGGWRHMLACGIGSITADLNLFSLVLLGREYFLPDQPNPAIQLIVASMGAIILLPLGIYLLNRGVKEPFRTFESARRRWDVGTVPGYLMAEVANAAALTIFNPLTIAYWIFVTPNWLPFAHSVWATAPPVWESLTVTAGLATWSTPLAVAVRFIAHRIGPNFVRLVNAMLDLFSLASPRSAL